MAEAEDAVQDAYLRWHDADRESVVDPRAFLITTTTRICLDVLKSARVRREEYVGPWLPDPVTDTAALAPDTQTEMAEDLSVALLLALDRLSPLERAAFLLHDVFDMPFADVARTIDRTEAACRQLATRARQAVRKERQAPQAPPEAHARLLAAFGDAVRSGEVGRLAALLREDAVLLTDGGGRKIAALNPIFGADRIARFFMGRRRKQAGQDVRLEPAMINGAAGALLFIDGEFDQTISLAIDGDKIAAIYLVRNPDKLRHVPASAH
jgi:RNA polymerase sigma-70 factor (ECF subfamily)